MKEDLKTILYMGLGAISETGELLNEAKDTLYEKGKDLYEKGVIVNEELKHNINETLNKKNKEHNTNDIVNILKNLNEQDKKEVMNKMGWTDDTNEQGAGIK